MGRNRSRVFVDSWANWCLLLKGAFRWRKLWRVWKRGSSWRFCTSWAVQIDIPENKPDNPESPSPVTSSLLYLLSLTSQLTRWIIFQKMRSMVAPSFRFFPLVGLCGCRSVRSLSAAFVEKWVLYGSFLPSQSDSQHSCERCMDPSGRNETCRRVGNCRCRAPSRFGALPLPKSFPKFRNCAFNGCVDCSGVSGSRTNVS